MDPHSAVVGRRLTSRGYTHETAKDGSIREREACFTGKFRKWFEMQMKPDNDRIRNIQ